MVEVAQQYRIISPGGLEDMANQLNRILSLLADRIDKLEGYRGTPTFRAPMDMQGNRITSAGAAAVDDDALILGQLTDVQHSSLQGLTIGDDHTQYALLAGRSGGQTLKGGTASGDDLILQSTNHVTRGHIEFKDSLKTFDANNVLIHGFLKE